MRINDLTEAAQTLTDDVGLYHTPGFFAIFHLDEDFKAAVEEYDMETIEDKALGMLSYNEAPEGKEWLVGSVWARKGYGPVLYEILGSLAGKDGFGPNQRQVSPAAKRVWEYMASRDDVEMVPVEDPPQTFQDFTYYLKKPLNVQKAQRRLKQFIGRDPFGEKESAMQEASDLLLSRKMGEIYPS